MIWNMNWSKFIYLNFIDFYRKRECLWNSAHDNYENKTEKLDA